MNDHFRELVLLFFIKRVEGAFHCIADDVYFAWRHLRLLSAVGGRVHCLRHILLTVHIVTSQQIFLFLNFSFIARVSVSYCIYRDFFF